VTEELVTAEDEELVNTFNNKSSLCRRGCACYLLHACFLLISFFDPEDGSEMFLP
jgi:hypothetical protein